VVHRDIKRQSVLTGDTLRILDWHASVRPARLADDAAAAAAAGVAGHPLYQAPEARALAAQATPPSAAQVLAVTTPKVRGAQGNLGTGPRAGCRS
jgi:hypothetical protein